MPGTEETQPAEIEVKTPVGSFRGRGTDLLGLITVLGICAILFMVYQNGLDAKASNVQVVSTIQKLADAQDKAATASDEHSFILTLDQKERTRLNLEMPATLRKRLRDR